MYLYTSSPWSLKAISLSTSGSFLSPLGLSLGCGISKYLDLWSCTSQAAGELLLYTLYAVLVHSGGSCHGGHYFCYTKVKSNFLPSRGKMCAEEDKLSRQCYCQPRFWRRRSPYGRLDLFWHALGSAVFLPGFLWRNHAVHLQISKPFFADQQWTVV